MIPTWLLGLLLQSGDARAWEASCPEPGVAWELPPCEEAPNCVSSRSPVSDTEHHIAPLSLAADPTTALEQIHSVLGTLPRTTRVSQSPLCLHYTEASRIFGWIDDIVFVFDTDTAQVQVRSAARTGTMDFGVNRRRVEHYRTLLSPPSP